MKKIIGIGTIVVGIISFILGILADVYEGQAITIIGGADGPTEMFFAGKIGVGWIDGVTIGIAFVIIGLCLIYNEQNKS